MADFSNPALPLVVSSNGGYGQYGTFSAADSCAHTLNGDIVGRSNDGVLNKLSSIESQATLRETLKSQCDLEHSIAALGYAVRENKFELKNVQCLLDHSIKNDGERTRDVVRAGFQRQDDQKIAKLELQLALAKQCGCGCAPPAVPA